MTDPKQPLTGPDVLAAGLDDWRLLMRALHARFRTGDFATGLRLAEGIGALAEAADHHPDVDLRYRFVDVRLFSHDVSAVTSRDLDLARSISVLAQELGVEAQPEAVFLLDLALDTADAAAIMPFWVAVLGYAQTRGDEVSDPGGSMPGMWFQQTEPHDPPRQRFHLDVFVPHDQAQSRVAAALAAGGTLVSDAEAPSFWVLADAEGNHACVCTWQPAAGEGTPE
jgi:4a-hydroxytetrahydrobiopterin dehydratase